MNKKPKSKKNKNGLVIEEDLAVNKQAGFKAVKRDKTVNRRAGLHDKKKDMQGDSKVLKHRPLALKRKRIARKVAAVLSVVFVGAVSYVGVGFLKKDTTPIDDPGFATVRYATPTDGSKPTDHTVVENVAYINYVLHNQLFWSSSMTSVVDNAFMDQTVKTYKQFYNGILISEDVESGFSSKITQFCVPEDVTLWRDENGVNHGVEADWAKKAVLWRGGSGGYKGLNTNWSSDPASGSIITDYRKERGLPSSEFSVYVLNELTIKNAQDTDVVDNGDGTFTMTLDLNVNPEGETSAVHYYKQQMKSKGGLSEMPHYYSTAIEFVFDENWRILESTITDGYRVKMGISVDCTSKTETAYNYGDEQTAKETVEKYYDGYFKEYKDKFANEVIGDPEPDATTMLATAFGSVMTGDGANFKINLGLDGKTTQGYAYVGMKDGALRDLRIKLGKDISAYILTENGQQVIYLALGSNAKIKLNLADMSAAFATETPKDPDASSQVGSDTPSDNEEEGSSSGFDVGELINQVLGGELTVNEENTKATLKCNITLFGITAKIDFYFNLNNEAENTDDSVSLDYVNATIIVGGSSVTAKLRFANDEIPAQLTATQKAAYQDVFKNGLSVGGKLGITAGGKLIDIVLENCALSFNGGLSLSLKAKIIAGGSYNDIYAQYKGGKLTFTYGNAYSIKTIEEQVDGDEASASTVGNIVGAVLDIEGGDLATLEGALVSLYNRIIGVVNAMVESGDFKTANSLSDIIEVLSGGKEVTNGLDGLFKMLELPTTTDGEYTIESILSGLNLYATGADVGVKLGVFGLEFGFNADGSLRLNLALKIAGSDMSLVLSDFNISPYESCDLSVPASELLSASDFAEMLDYLGAAAELLTAEDVTATAAGNVDLGAGDGYTFDAKLQYSQGANGFPVHINAGKENNEGLLEGVNFWMDSTLYTHFNLNLVSTSSANDSLYIDFYVLDANPTTTTDGKTGAAYTTDGKLDIYLYLSKYAEGAKNYNPLKIYMPVEDLLTIATMGVSMLDIGSLNFNGNENLTEEQVKDLNLAIKQISNVLNQLLVSKYLATDSDRYASLGSSIINQILSSLGAKQQNLQQLLDWVVDSIFAKLNPEEGATGGESAPEADSEEDVPELVEGNYVKKLTMNGGFNLLLNSASVYGADKDDLSILLTKQGTGAGSHITGATLDNIYFGEDNASSLNLTAEFNYNKVEKPASLADFKNFGNIDALIKALVNSATHKTTQAEYNAGVKTDYSLNRNFTIAGMLTAKVLGQEIPLTIEGFSVNIDKDNKVDFNIRIGLLPKWGIIDGETYIDLTIRNDMIYIKRTLKSKYTGTFGEKLTLCNEVEYRIMPLSAFTANMMDNITFMLNVGDTLASILKSINMSGGDKEPLTFNDFGDYIGNFVSLYSHTADGNNHDWTVDINGASLTKLSGVSIDNVGVTFKAEETDGIMLVKSLYLNATIFSAISLSGNLVYCNPQYDGTDSYDWKPVKVNEGTEDEYTVKGNKTVDLANDALQGVGGYSWAQLLGGTKFEDICEHTDWNALTSDLGATYLSYNATSVGKIGGAILRFEREAIGGGYTEIGDGKIVLYNTESGKIYTYFTLPELAGSPNLNGVSPEWRPSYIKEGNSLIYRAVYNISYVQNEEQLDESYIENAATNSYIKTCEIAANGDKIYLPKDIIVEKDGVLYGLNRYVDLLNGSSALNLATYTAGDGVEWFVINANEKFAVKAVWERVYKVTFTNGENETPMDEIVKYFYAGDVLSESSIPAVPEKEGYFGVWANDSVANASGFKVEANDAGYVFRVKYGEKILLKIISDNALSGIVGFNYDGTAYSNGYLEGSQAVLPDISGYSVDKTYYFDGYYTNENFNGERYESGYAFDISSETKFFAKWLSKTITLKYSSDVDMTLSGETQTTFDYNSTNGALASATATQSGLIYLGWFVKGDSGSYVYADKVDTIRSACRGMVESAETAVEVEVWAMWVTDANIVTTYANRTSKWMVITVYYWEIHGYVTGGEAYGARSVEIASQEGLITVDYTMRYEQCNYKDGVPDQVDSGKDFNVNNLSEPFDILTAKTYTFTNVNISDSDKQYASKRSYGGGRIKVTYFVNGSTELHSYEKYSHFTSGYNAE